MNIKLKLLFKDRVGIVADISVLIARQGFNIVSMEVIHKNIEAQVYVEIENRSKDANKDELFKLLGVTNNLLEINYIKILPQEEREHRFRVALDNIND